jgi:CRISPR/Cas system-associated protein Cas10 (large subunit of type III CRISPR-Cas system)
MNLNQTLILGDLSGLQDYLFDVAAEGGGQARRLRARSLSISLLAECAANWYFRQPGSSCWPVHV